MRDFPLLIFVTCFGVSGFYSAKSSFWQSPYEWTLATVLILVFDQGDSFFDLSPLVGIFRWFIASGLPIWT